MKHYRHTLWHWKHQVPRWFTTVRIFGLLLTGCGVLVLLLPEILVFMTASLFIAGGIFLILAGTWDPTPVRHTSTWAGYERPFTVYRMHATWD